MLYLYGMPNNYFQFKQFRIEQDKTAMKVCTDSCLFGAWVHPSPSTKNILDIGTGTGLLSLMLAQKTMAYIDAIEIDNDAFEQAKTNIASSKWNEKIELLHGDVRTYDFKKSYDLIICNPPFYINEQASVDEGEQIAKHSSKLSLPELLNTMKKLVSEDGAVALLLPYYRKEECIFLALEQGFFLEQLIDIQQSPKHSFFRFAGIFTTHQPTAPKSSTIAIKNEDDKYSEAFTELLKPYYLNL